MKEQDHFWEGEVRRNVTEHEFEFEPVAWEEMSQLLDQTALPPQPPAAHPVSDLGRIAYWKPFLLILLGVGLLSLLYLRPTPTPPSTGERRVPAPSNTLPPAVAPVPAATKNKTNSSLTEETWSYPTTPTAPPQLLPAPPKPVSTTDQAATPATPDPTPKPTPVPPRPGSPLAPLPRQRTIPLLALPRVPISPTLKLLPPPKRQRDPRKLYPDVIENY